MKFSAALLSFGCVMSALASPVEKSMEISLTRVDAGKKKSHSSGEVQEKLGRSLYWFGNFDVGDTKNAKLLIDTGSTDLLLNPGLYKPSKHMTKFSGTTNFTISYEGVNRAGFGFETLNGTLSNDQVTGAGGLTVRNQTIGSIKSYKYTDTKNLPYAIQGDGIIGFAGPRSSSFHPQQNSWFYNLCQYKAIASCQLGLAYGTKGKGVANIGKLNSALINGSLVNVPMIQDSYVVRGDVYLNNKLIAPNQTFIMDEGTNNIQGPIDVTTKIFQQLGYPTHTTTGPSLGGPPTKVQQAYFACNKPPTLGFAFPPKSELKAGEKSTVFNVSPDVWDVYKHGNNNCTSILGGTNAEGPFWLLGQPFFAGHYVNFNVQDHMMGYGFLKNPSG